jgi:uncharacterized phage-associated protein
MMIRFRFQEEKAIAALLYIARQLISLKNPKAKPDLHKIFKILYFADQKHLARYGRPILGDFYIAMDHGPVPSQVYDMVKIVRGDTFFEPGRDYDAFFEVRDHYIHPKQKPSMDLFSESDLECIDESFRENKFLSFNQLKDKSHDEAYCKAAKDDKISYRKMAKLAGANASMLAYIQEVAENERLLG